MNTDAAPTEAIAAENLTGRRIVAGIIDVVILAVVFFISSSRPCGAIRNQATATSR